MCYTGSKVGGGEGLLYLLNVHDMLDNTSCVLWHFKAFVIDADLLWKQPCRGGHALYASSLCASKPVHINEPVNLYMYCHWHICICGRKLEVIRRRDLFMEKTKCRYFWGMEPVNMYWNASRADLAFHPLEILWMKTKLIDTIPLNYWNGKS